ncbi:DNA topoisomerase [Geoalkalibacter sp.]|uniref:DNA topoisomerase n=1 Tax=Geoalkalibacter sp. TaxID=3041440 RepID=UPI00272DF068|nr:DNA topoisomerase [Geoalkalibacter sp.]
MDKALILTEKRNVALDFRNALEPAAVPGEFHIEGERYLIFWAKGHLVTLCEPQDYDRRLEKWDLSLLPILPEHYQFRVIAGEEPRLEALSRLLRRADVGRVILATDPGREGEVIGRLILEHAANQKPLYRFWTSQALSVDGVLEGMRRLRPIHEFNALNEAGLARLMADWLVGINGTRALTARAAHASFTWPLGRVKAPVVRMIAQRQQAIESFEPEPFWNLRARFLVDETLGYAGSWIGSSGREEQIAFLPENEQEQALQLEQGVSLERLEENTRIFDRFAAHRAINRACAYGLRLEKRKSGQRFFPRENSQGEPVRGLVKDVLSEHKQIPAPQLFHSAALLEQAYHHFGFPVEKTECLAQRLYQHYKLISYPRTASRVLPQNAVDQVLLVLRLLREDGLVFNPALVRVDAGQARLFNDKEIIEGHHAIIPTGVRPKDLSRDEARLYDLIARHFLAAFHPPFVYRSLQVLTEVGGEIFSSRKSALIEAGWKGFLQHQWKPAGEKEALETLKKGASVSLVFLVLTQGATSPPPPYNDATLIHDMTHVAKFVDDPELKKVLRRCAGIGTAATQGRILKEIVDAGYVMRRAKGRGLSLEPKGRALAEVLAEQDLLDPGTTGLWEARLERIAREEGGSRQAFLAEVRDFVVRMVDGIRTIPQARLDTARIIGPCPQCGDQVVERARSFCCRASSGCRFIFWKDRLAKLGKPSITAEEMHKLLAGGVILLSKLKGAKTRVFDTRGCLTKGEHGWTIRFLKEDEQPQPWPRSAPQPLGGAPAPEAFAASSGAQVPAAIEQAGQVLAIARESRVGEGARDCWCCDLPEPSAVQRPGACDPEVFALASHFLVARLEEHTRRDCSGLLAPLAARLAQRDHEGSSLRDFLDQQGELAAAGSWPQAFFRPQAVLEAAHRRLCGAWLARHGLQARIEEGQSARFWSAGGYQEATVISSLPEAGLYRLACPQNQDQARLLPWEEVFCPLCGRSGIAQTPQASGKEQRLWHSARAV